MINDLLILVNKSLRNAEVLLGGPGSDGGHEFYFWFLDQLLEKQVALLGYPDSMHQAFFDMSVKFHNSVFRQLLLSSAEGHRKLHLLFIWIAKNEALYQHNALYERALRFLTRFVWFHLLRNLQDESGRLSALGQQSVFWNNVVHLSGTVQELVLGAYDLNCEQLQTKIKRKEIYSTMKILMSVLPENEEVPISKLLSPLIIITS